MATLLTCDIAVVHAGHLGSPLRISCTDLEDHFMSLFSTCLKDNLSRGIHKINRVQNFVFIALASYLHGAEGLLSHCPQKAAIHGVDDTYKTEVDLFLAVYDISSIT
jgi:hypothetical protein